MWPKQAGHVLPPSVWWYLVDTIGDTSLFSVRFCCAHCLWSRIMWFTKVDVRLSCSNACLNYLYVMKRNAHCTINISSGIYFLKLHRPNIFTYRNQNWTSQIFHVIVHSSLFLVKVQCYYTHTHIRLTALCPRPPGWAGTRKVKPVWILLKQQTVSGSGIRWAICKSAPLSRQTTMPAPHRSAFYRPDALPAAQPTVSKHWKQLQWYCTSYSFTKWHILNKHSKSDIYMTCQSVQSYFSHAND